MFDFDPYAHVDCAELARFADDGGPATETAVCDTIPLSLTGLQKAGCLMNISTIDPHSHDFHVYVDGTLRHRVPCGVCEGPDNSALADVATRYGVELHATIREQVREHLESAYKLSHPDSAVRVE